jgi:YVTN family beta-propeller protein
MTNTGANVTYTTDPVTGHKLIEFSFPIKSVPIHIFGHTVHIPLLGSFTSDKNTVKNNINTVSVINIATSNVTATVPVGQFPEGVAVTPDGAKVFVANSNDDTVSVINTTSNAVTATVPVGNNPDGIAVSPDGKKVYVANFIGILLL